MATHNYDLTVMDRNGIAVPSAIVRIYDKDGNLDVDTITDAAGAISTATLDDTQDPYRIDITPATETPHYKTYDRRFYVTAAIADSICLDWADGLEQTFTDYISGSATIKYNGNPSGGSSTARCYYYKASTKSYRALTVGGDLFDDDVAVGDCLIFLENGYSNTYWRNLWLNISVATDGVIKGVWEHHNCAGTTGTTTAFETQANWYQKYAGLKDDTLGFTVTGGAGLYFNYEKALAGSYHTFSAGTCAAGTTYTKHGWRFRVTSVSGVTEGGALAALPTYGTNQITVTGTGATPATLYAASVAGGWNNVFTQGGNYNVMAGLSVGDGVTTTTFVLANGAALSIGAPNGSSLGNPSYPLAISSTGTLAMGTKQSDGTGTNGGFIYINVASNLNGGYGNSGTFNCYGSTLYVSSTNFSGSTIGNGEAIDSTFVNMAFSNYSAGKRYDFTRCYIMDVTAGSTAASDPSYAGSIGFTNCRFWKKANVMLITHGTEILVNVEKMHTAYSKFFGGYGATTAFHWYIRNPVGSNWSSWPNEISWGTSTSQTANVQFSFDLKVTDGTGAAISGATVSFVGIYDTIAAQMTDANGDIEQQWITYWYGTQPNQAGAYYANPMTVIISRPGYRTKTVKYTMSEKRIEIESLDLASINIDLEQIG